MFSPIVTDYWFRTDATREGVEVGSHQIVVDDTLPEDRSLVKTAPTIEELAAQAGLPPTTLRETVDHFNAMVDKGVDEELGRFGPGQTYKPKKVARPPFYAVQFLPLARKNFGGVRTDLECRVLRSDGTAIDGLFAAGELAGMAGGPGRIHECNERVAVAVVAQASHSHDVSGRLALPPDLVA